MSTKKQPSYLGGCFLWSNIQTSLLETGLLIKNP